MLDKIRSSTKTRLQYLTLGACFCFLTPELSQAQFTYTVGPLGTGAPFQTVSAAIQAINANTLPGATHEVTVLPGIYQENFLGISAGRNVSFKGPQNGNSPNTGTPRNPSSNTTEAILRRTAAGSSLFTLASNVNISFVGFVFDLPAHTALVNGSAITALHASTSAGSTINLQKNIFTASASGVGVNTLALVYARNAARLAMDDNKILGITSATTSTDLVYSENSLVTVLTNNVVLNDPNNPNSAQVAFRINNSGSAGNSVTIKSNKLSGTRENAVHITGAPNDEMLVDANEISNFTGNGLFLYTVSNGKITNNKISGNQAGSTGVLSAGVHLVGAQNTDVKSNVISSIRGAGIRVDDDALAPSRNLMIRYNDITSANLANDAVFGAGVSLYSRSTANLTKSVYVLNNVLKSNGFAGIAVSQRAYNESSGTSCNITGKDFRANYNVLSNNGGSATGTGVYLGRQLGVPGQIDITGNWWGGSDAIGPNGATRNLLNSAFGQKLTYATAGESNVAVYSPWLGGPTNPDLVPATPGFDQMAEQHTYYGIPFQVIDPSQPADPLVPSTQTGGVEGVINRAISLAKSGDIIEVWGVNPTANLNATNTLSLNDLVYRENITIPENFGTLTLRAAQNKDNAVAIPFPTFSNTAARKVTGNKEAILFQPTGGAGLRINDGNMVWINGFKIVSTDNQAVQSMGANTQVTFVNNLVEVWQTTTNPQIPTRNLVSTGVVSFEEHLLPLTITGNYFRRTSASSDDASVALYAENCVKVSIENNTFNGSSTGLATGNASLNMANGIRLAGCGGASADDIAVRGNLITSTRLSGLYIMDAPGGITRNVRVEYNEITGNNTASNSAHAGITISANNASMLMVNNNVINNNNVNGVYVPSTVNAGGKRFVFNYNLFSGNTIGFSYTGAGVIDAAGNWWGRLSGPVVATNRTNAGATLSGTGAQQLVGSAVSYSPWLADDATGTANANNNPDDDANSMGFQNTSAKAYYIGIITAGPVPPNSSLGFVQRANDLAKDNDIIFFHDDDYVNGAQPGAPADVTVNHAFLFSSVSPVTNTRIGSITVVDGKQVRIANDFQVNNIDLAGDGDGSIITFLPPLTLNSTLSTVKTMFFIGWLKEGPEGRYVIGNLKTTRFVGSAPQYFGETSGFPVGIGYHLIPSPGATALSQWTITRSAGTEFPASPSYVYPPYTIAGDNSIDRVFNIEYVGANPDAGWNAAIAWLSDNDNDPGGVFPKQLNMRHSLNGGVTWPTLQPTFTVPDTDPRVLGPVAINTTNFQFKKALYTVMRGCQIVTDAGADINVCANFNGQLNATAQAGAFPSGGTYTYSWAPTFGLSSTTVRNPIVNLPVAGTFLYVVTATDAVGCSDFDTVAVVVSAQVKATLSGGAAICPGESVTFPIEFEGSSPWTFTYTRNGANPTTITTSTTPYQLTVTPPTTPGTYTYALTSVTSPCGPGIATGSGFALVKPKPTAAIGVGTPSTICIDQTTVFAVQLTGTAPWSFTYLENGENPRTVSNLFSTPYTLTASPSGLGQRTFTISNITDGTTCNNVGTGMPVVNVIPGFNTAAISGTPTPICFGEAATFTVNFSGTRPWTLQYAENGGAPVTVSGINQAAYTLTVTPTGTGTRSYSLVSIKGSGATCTGGSVSGSASVTVNPGPSATLSGNAGTICQGQTATFTLNLSGVPPYSVTYRENEGTPMTVSGINATTYTLTVTPTGTGSRVYALMNVTDANCTTGTVSGNGMVNVTPAPSAALSGTTTINVGASANLTFGITGGSAPYTITYRVNGGNPITVSGINSSPFTLAVSPNAAGTYNYVLTSVNDGNCTGVASGTATVTVVNSTSCTLASQLPAKVNEGTAVTACGSLALTPSVSANGAYTYQWRLNGTNISGATSRNYTATASGDYSVRIVEPGCTTAVSQSISVTIIGTATLVVNATSASTSTSTDGKIEATASVSAGQIATFEYRLTGPVTRAYQASNTFSNLPAGDYIVFVRQVATVNCEVSRSVTVGVQTANGAPTLSVVDGSVSINRATLSWTSVSGVAAYTLQFRVAGATAWTEISGVTANSRILTGLQTSTTYEARVRASSSGSPLSNVVTFTTSGVTESCGRPSGIYANVINNTSATINWTSVSEAVCYDVEYRLAASSWISVSPKPTAGQTSVTISGLSPNSSYQIRLRSNCVSCPAATANLSVYSPTISFVTSGATKDGESVIPFNDGFDVSVYPNPTNGAFSVALETTMDGEANLEVFDMAGRSVLVRTFMIEGGKNEVALDLSSQPAGVYLMKVANGESVQMVKVILR